VRCASPGLGDFLLGEHIGENAHNVALLHDQQVLPIDLDLGAGPFAKQHPLTDFDVDRN